jgi:Flp pilus assembly protein TadD
MMAVCSTSLREAAACPPSAICCSESWRCRTTSSTALIHGGALYRNGEHAKALDALYKAVTLHGKPNPLTQSLLALTHMTLGQKDKATAALKQAPPGNDAAWEDVYLLRLMQPEIDAALAQAEQKLGAKEKD